jgi:mono/diheme cytochrome c family protein
MPAHRRLKVRAFFSKVRLGTAGIEQLLVSLTHGLRRRFWWSLRMPSLKTLVVLGTWLDASTANAADAAHGADLAKRWCASCHLVESDQKQANSDVPTFAAIAQQADFTPEKIAFFLLDPHPKMPNFSLTRSESSDLAAYIGSLRK